MAQRFLELQTWVAEALRLPMVNLEPVSADASFRRYYRVHDGSRSMVVMDAPPPREDCRPFVHAAGLLKAAGVHAPAILAQDLTHGFLLLEDLGRQSYLDVLNSVNADTLFADAMDTLIRWQAASRPGVLPHYDRLLLRRELNLFPEWYLQRHLGISLTASEQSVLDAMFHLLENNSLAQPQVFVHRDFMPRNLMVSTPNPGVLDFQDAVYGPITYDVLCLLKDAFISWEEPQLRAWRRQYWGRARHVRLQVQAFAEFERAFDWMGVQRHLKVLGIFSRLSYRDGKPDYLKDTPRFLNYVRETAARYSEFLPLLHLLDAADKRAQNQAAVTCK